MTEPEKTGSDLCIVDNSEVDWKVLQYLREWCSISHTSRIALGPLNVFAQPIVIEASPDRDVRVVAEFVEVVRANDDRVE
jgi:hypothetical protein